ncbi:hypothetical protein CANARDRAFT_182258, partial [[Candida] arabinofermentans NRRL YB-2248]
IRFGYNEDELKSLSKDDGSSMAYPENKAHRSGCVVNCGGFPLCSSWFNSTLTNKPNHRYLFVSVLGHPDSLVKPEFAMLGTSSYNAGLIVYDYDIKQQTAKPIKHIVIPYGAITEMKWVLSDNESESLLACLCKDGKVRILRINEQFLLEHQGYTKLSSASITIEIPNFTILSFDWTSPMTLALGLNDGYISELDIRDPSNPYYIYSLEIQDIVALTSTYSDKLFTSPEQKNYSRIIHISSLNYHSYILDLDNFCIIVDDDKRTREPKTLVPYSSLLDMFVTLESGFRGVKLQSKRDSQYQIAFQIPSDVPPCQVCLNDYSTIAITGHPSGTVRLSNLGKKLIAGNKPDAELASLLRIFKLDRDVAKDAYRLDLGYGVEQSDSGSKPSTETIFENELIITSLSYRNARDDLGLFSCCYANGLIVIEKLLGA